MKTKSNFILFTCGHKSGDSSNSLTFFLYAARLTSRTIWVRPTAIVKCCFIINGSVRGLTIKIKWIIKTEDNPISHYSTYILVAMHIYIHRMATYSLNSSLSVGWAVAVVSSDFFLRIVWMLNEAEVVKLNISISARKMEVPLFPQWKWSV